MEDGGTEHPEWAGYIAENMRLQQGSTEINTSVPKTGQTI
jgi:hypothetical protein